MPITPVAEQVFRIGLGNYVSARYAAFAGFFPVAGLLARRALLALLTAARPLDQREPGPHDLKTAWAAFKSAYPAATLASYDAAIEEIDWFARLEAPHAAATEGMQCSADWSGLPGDRHPVAARRDPSAPDTPSYHLSLHDLDRLVRAVFESCKVNPAYFLTGLTDHAAKYLYMNNAFFTSKDAAPSH